MPQPSAPTQATVYAFDEETGSGTIVRDDGTIETFDVGAFLAGGLRLLRAGQRVRVSRADDGRISALTIATLPDA